jgi:iron complex transport system substrate-binding protein
MGEAQKFTTLPMEILLIGRVIGCHTEAEKLAADFERQLRDLRRDEEPRPRIYFEEWDEPLITGIGLVMSEAIKLVGGDENVFFRPDAKASRERQIEGTAVCNADPQIIFASWCGKPVDLRQITTRPGWDSISAVRSGEIHEIDSADILQPGPRVLKGIKQMSEIIKRWQRRFPQSHIG